MRGRFQYEIAMSQDGNRPRMRGDADADLPPTAAFGPTNGDVTRKSTKKGTGLTHARSGEVRSGKDSKNSYLSS